MTIIIIFTTTCSVDIYSYRLYSKHQSIKCIKLRIIYILNGNIIKNHRFWFAKHEKYLQNMQKAWIKKCATYSSLLFHKHETIPTRVQEKKWLSWTVNILDSQINIVLILLLVSSKIRRTLKGLNYFEMFQQHKYNMAC